MSEWLIYIDSDPELDLSENDSDDELKPEPGFCTWSAYSSDGQQPWFAYSNGRIHAKNPDERTIEKMLSIAEALNAKVQGDDGEIYELSDNGRITYKHISSGNETVRINTTYKKPWWKFW